MIRITHSVTPFGHQVLLGARTEEQSEAYNLWIAALDKIGAFPKLQSINEEVCTILIEGGSVAHIKDIYYSSEFSEFVYKHFLFRWKDYNLRITLLDDEDCCCNNVKRKYREMKETLIDINTRRKLV